ncbi:MAG: DNA polymerase IV [Halanaerobiales bacterium]|nr:DNA polymerase IV [Halanaerobiales bacterium]
MNDKKREKLLNLKKIEDCHIIHVDMDAFFAAVEQRDNPELIGKPVIVGGSDPNSRGVVSTCSYEARKYGIHSAMPLREAYRRCPEGVYLNGSLRKYNQVSKQIKEIFFRFTPLVEPLSLDEAFLNVQGCERLFGNSVEIGLKIKDLIEEELNLVASVGVAPNKFLAKLSSDLEKPDGFVVITKDKIEEVLWPLPVTRLWGVGQKTAEYLISKGIKTIGMLAKLDPEILRINLGKMGPGLYRLAHGIDDRKVEPHYGAKSVGNEITFKEDTSDLEFLETTLLKLAEQVGRRLRKSKMKGRTVNIKLRYSNFKTITRSKTLSSNTNLSQTIYEVGLNLLRSTDLFNKSFRLVGISISNIAGEENQQMSLFEEKVDLHSDILSQIMDDLKDRFGEDAVTRARLIGTKGKKLWVPEKDN